MKGLSEREPIHEPTLPIFDDEADWVHHAAERFEGSSSTEILEWALERFHPRMAISAAGGVDGMAIIDMAWRINPDVRVFTLDTGRLPPETYQLFEEIREKYGIDVEFEFPERTAVERLVNAEGPEPDVQERGPAAGVLRDPQGGAAEAQARLARCVGRGTPARAVAHAEEHREGGARPRSRRHREAEPARGLDRGRGVGLRPRRTTCPYHELFDHGYASIGCAPCTRPVQPAESERAGRWWWESETDKECGIHCSVGLLGTKSDRERLAEVTAVRP